MRARILGWSIELGQMWISAHLSFKEMQKYVLGLVTHKHTLTKQTTSNLNSPQFASPLPQLITLFFPFFRERGGGVRSCQTPSPLCFSQYCAGIVWRACCVPAATDCGPSLPRSRALEAAIIWTPASPRHMGNY